MSISAKAKINELKLHLGSSKHKSEDYKLSYHLVSVSQQPLKIYHSSYDNQNI